MPYRVLAVLFTTASLASAAVPTISSIESVQSTHASVMWRYQVGAPSYVRILFGTASGVYPYATQSYSSGYENNVWAIIPVTGLQPGTTYYFRMTARPNTADDTDICESDACGSMEQVFTTPAEPSPHPSLPTQPALYQPVLPDTTSYAIVPMKVNTDGTCVAAAAVPASPVGVAVSVPMTPCKPCSTRSDTARWSSSPKRHLRRLRNRSLLAHRRRPPEQATGPGRRREHRLSQPQVDRAPHRRRRRTDFPPFGVRTAPELWRQIRQADRPNSRLQTPRRQFELDRPDLQRGDRRRELPSSLLARESGTHPSDRFRASIPPMWSTRCPSPI